MRSSSNSISRLISPSQSTPSISFSEYCVLRSEDEGSPICVGALQLGHGEPLSFQLHQLPARPPSAFESASMARHLCPRNNSYALFVFLLGEALLSSLYSYGFFSFPLPPPPFILPLCPHFFLLRHSISFFLLLGL